MSLIFQLRLLGEHQATFIVADTDEDAIAQAKEAKKATGKIVMSFFNVSEQPKHRLAFERSFFLNARNRKTAHHANVRRLSKKPAAIMPQHLVACNLSGKR